MRTARAAPRRCGAGRAVADVDRQVVVDRAFGDALQAFDADVADGELACRLAARTAGAARTGPTACASRDDFNRIRPGRRSAEQPCEVVIERQRHQHDQHRDADLLAEQPVHALRPGRPSPVPRADRRPARRRGSGSAAGSARRARADQRQRGQEDERQPWRAAKPGVFRDVDRAGGSSATRRP